MAKPEQMPAEHSRIMAVTGGKVGVGKTSVALNLGLALARLDCRVLLLDAGIDPGNAVAMLGQHPSCTLETVLAGECSLSEAIFEAPHGLHILPAVPCVEHCVDMSEHERLALLRNLATLEKQYDYILIDTAAGVRTNVIHMIASAALACVVVTPDPTSLTDAFSLLKELHRRGYRRTPSVLVNMAAGASQARSIFQRFHAALQRHLGVELHYLGAIWRDETLRQAVVTQRPVALMPLADPSCRQFLSLAERVRLRLDQTRPRKGGFAAYWNHVARRRLHQSTTSTLPQKSASDRTTGRQASDGAQGTELKLFQAQLAAMQWQTLSTKQRQQFAISLRKLASRVESDVSGASPATLSVSEKANNPHYDEASFGTQTALLRKIKEHPDHVSLDDLLDALTRKND